MTVLLDHEKFCKEMDAQSLKQEPLAELLDISDRHIRNLRSKDIDVAASLLYKLSEVLQVPMDQLLTEKKEPEHQEEPK